MTSLPVTQVALSGFALIAALVVMTWLASLVCRDVSLVDRVWPVLIAGAALVYFVLLPSPGWRGACMMAVAAAWAARLGLYITVRNWGHGEDRRYQVIRARNEPHFAFKSLYLVFGLQALLAWTVSAPFLAGMAADRPIWWLDMAGLVVAVLGIAFEATGDAQLARFKGDPANKGSVMDLGLWRYTRHPNYFGEACVWWGLWLVALGGSGWAAAWSVVSPVLITFLLLKVSGVALLEKDMARRHPAYRDYMQRTSAFIPWLPNKKEHR